MRTLSFFSCGVLAALSLTVVGCGSDDTPGPLGGGSGADGSGGRGSGGSSAGTGGGAVDADGGPDAGGAGSGGGGQGSGGAGPDSGGAGSGGAGPIDGSLFPPIEAGAPVPEDAGTPTPRACTPTGNTAISADPCRGFAEAECHQYAQCGARVLQAQYGDEPTCVAVRERQCQELFGGGGSTVLSAVHACAVALVDAPCGCVQAEACPGALEQPGTRADGQPCASAHDCIGGSCGRTGTGCGTCRTGAGEGESCEPECRVGLVCSSARVCIQPRQRGQRCDSTKDCSPGLACVDGTCGDPPPEGADCRNDLDVCDVLGGMYCVEGACRVLPVVTATGNGDDARCGKDPQGTLGVCAATASCVAGHCQPRGGQGAPCAPNGCLPGLECSQGQCAAGSALTCN